MKFLMVILLLLTAACAGSYVHVPITVKSVYLYEDGKCSLKLRSDDGVWTDPSPDQCQYKVGDILK